MCATATSVLDHCVLSNPVFTRLGKPTFRRSESDGAPVMIIPFGDSMAALPLRSLRREFGIEDDSPDGRMLEQIAESLDFVAGLTLGDPFPSEILTGEASWQPSSKHQQIAAAKLRQQLLDWVDPTLSGGKPPSLERMENEPALRAAVQRAFDQAAKELGLPNREAVAILVGDVAGELSYIEALRETFLRRVQSMVERLEGLTGAIVNKDRQTTLGRIRRLAHLALQQLASRFVEVDAQTGEVMMTLRHTERHRSFIRAQRDWLYRSSRAWQQTLSEWDGAMPGLDDATWARLTRTYQFLAPRFMPVQEWFSTTEQTSIRRTKKPQHIMTW